MLQAQSLNQTEILAQLELVLGSDEFRKSPRLRKFLKYVVEQTLTSGAEFIRSYVIAVEVFDKGSSFDPGDPYVRNIARLTRVALRNYYQDKGEQDPVRIDVPPGNYIATFTAQTGGPQVVPKTPIDGDIVYKTEGTRHEPEPAVSNAGLLPTLAIIPLKYQGAGAANELVIGEVLAANIIAGLSKSSHINVISRLSTTLFRESSSDLGELSRKLNADYALSGNYQCQGQKLTISVEIADCKTLEVIWADNLQCSISEMLAADDSVVDEMVLQTARAVLHQEIRRAAAEPLHSLALHTKLVAGVHYMHSMSPDLFDAARNQFNHIIGRYPNHPTIHALLAHWYVLKINRSGGWSIGEDKRNKASAVQHCEMALESNPGHPLALTMFGLIETHMNRNPDKGLELYSTAEHLNPNEPLVFACKAAALAYQEKGSLAVDFALKALALSPMDPQLHLFHTCAAAAHYAAGNYDEAELHATKGFELNPHHTSNLRTLVAIQVEQGNLLQARKSAARLMDNDPGFTTSSYLSRSPNAGYPSGQKIASSLEQAGIPRH